MFFFAHLQQQFAHFFFILHDLNCKVHVYFIIVLNEISFALLQKMLTTETRYSEWETTNERSLQLNTI